MGGYWFGPSMVALAAAARTSSGPSESGKPWPRLIAPCLRASPDITSNTVVGNSANRGFMPSSRGDGDVSRSMPEGRLADGDLGAADQLGVERRQGLEGAAPAVGFRPHPG